MEDKIDSLFSILVLVILWILREVVPLILKKYKSSNGSSRMKDEISYIYGREKDREAVEEYKYKEDR